MNFEHLIQINDPLNPLLDPLTREQVWQGLLLRVEQPHLFVAGLDQCTILSREGDTIERELKYGVAKVRDRVTLTPSERVRYEIAATDSHVGGTLTMTIEAPDEMQLFLRFEYSTTLPEPSGSDDRQTTEILKSAYREADIDTVRLIREFAHTGELPRKLH
ncbi:MAG TPA: SRPBCC family protein [Pararobbsia sp.]|nr:SRPBCC family protein [Pararobbsia sp.]